MIDEEVIGAVSERKYMEDQRELSDHDLLILVDLRTRNLELQMQKLQAMLENKYVTHFEFEPVKKLVYGLVGAILSAVILALLALVLNSGGVIP